MCKPFNSLRLSPNSSRKKEPNFKEMKLAECHNPLDKQTIVICCEVTFLLISLQIHSKNTNYMEPWRLELTY